ncbi:MAG: Hsp20/alpha crystallin family protein [Candidatus Eremiobacteraeota bacterium]|nr:Hsp20/alpha crystallin family protein [Candidatus Eremiobacteraeota bacterium]
MSTTLSAKKEEIRPLFDRFFDIADPFSDLSSVRRTMNSLLDSVMLPAPRHEIVVPAMDLYFKDGRYTIEVALPGIDKKDVDIEIEGNRLTVSGKFAAEEKDAGKRYHYRELRRGGFVRSMTFPEDIDPAKVTAAFDSGLLKIEIPSLRPAPTQKVAIK